MDNPGRVTLDDLRARKRAGRKWAMLTAYDHPTAVAAQAAGIASLLVGDSMGSVVLGQESTHAVPLELMLILGEAVRRGAPQVFLVGDLPYEAVRGGPDAVRAAADAFRRRCGSDAVKLEALPEHADLVGRLVADGHVVIAHLGLRPQTVQSREQLRAQARDADGIAQLAADCAAMCAAGAQMLLLEAIPNEAAQAVLAACDVPVIGCGAGPACDAQVVVTHDLLGIGGGRPPKFVKVYADLGARTLAAMSQYVAEVERGVFPGPEHTYPMRKAAAPGGAPGPTTPGAGRGPAGP